MADNIVQSLFGTTPEMYQAAQQQQARQNAIAMAQLDPMQRAVAGLNMAGYNLGQGIGGALGAEDPQLQKISTINALSRQFDVTTPQGLASMAQELKGVYPDVAIQLANQAQTMQAASTEAKRKELTLTQEENLRKELAALGPGASQDQILGVVTKYGSADKVLAALQGSADRAAQREQALTIAREAQQARIDAARERGESAERIAQMQIEGRREIAQLTAALKQGQQANKPLSTQDIKMTNDLTASFKDASFGIDEAKRFTEMLDKGGIKFGAVENLASKARGLAGQSTPSDVAKSDLEKWITSSVNAVLNQAKGVQARDDAERAQKQIMDALDKNDPKLVRNGIQRIQKLLENTKDDAISGLELIGQERNRNLTGRLPSGTGTKDNPIVLK